MRTLPAAFLTSFLRMSLNRISLTIFLIRFIPLQTQSALGYRPPWSTMARRTRTLTAEPCQLGAPVAPARKRTRTLAAPASSVRNATSFPRTQPQRRLTAAPRQTAAFLQPKVREATFPCLSLEAEEAVPQVAGLVSDATTDEEGPAVIGKAARTLKAKATRRSKLMASTESGNLTFLEHSAIAANERYDKALDEWMTFAEDRNHPLVEDKEVDVSLVEMANLLFSQGHSPYRGETLLAALMHRDAGFGRFGNRHVPRFHRALKGWRRRVPPRSRDPHSWAVWAMVMWGFCRRNEYLQAIYIGFLVIGYFRPSEALTLQRRDVQRPVRGVSKRWHALLFPEDRPLRSKVYAANDSVELSSRFATWWDRVLEVLVPGDPCSLLFPFGYQTFLKTWHQVMKELPLRMVPYEARHSGPSIDSALGLRTRKEVQEQGRWSSDKSVLRYERKARLTMSLNKLTPAWRNYAETCESRLEALLLRGANPEDVALPAIHA